jgi:hypothetical protein
MRKRLKLSFDSVRKKFKRGCVCACDGRLAGFWSLAVGFMLVQTAGMWLQFEETVLYF